MDDKGSPSTHRKVEDASSKGAVETDKKVRKTTNPAGRKSKRGLIIGGISGGLAVVLAVVAIILYNVWYQNPDKVIMDTIVNTAAASEARSDSEVRVSNKDVDMVIALETNTVEKQTDGTAHIKVESKDAQMPLKIDTSANVIYEPKDGESTIYFKLNDLDKTVNDILELSINSMTEQYSQYGYSSSDVKKMKEQQLKEARKQFDPIIKKVNNRWLKTSVEESKSMECYAEGVEKFRSDKAMRREVAAAYKDSPFITIDKKLGSKKGSLGYRLSVDNKQQEEFSKDLKGTEFGKLMADCDDSSSSAAPSTSPAARTSSDDDDVRVEVWSSRWTHKLRELDISGTSKSSSGLSQQDETKFSLNTSISYSPADPMEVPKDATDIDELKGEKELGTLPLSGLL